MPNNDSIRINAYISKSGICSRREAERFITMGTVFINGRRAKIGESVSPTDKVMVNGQLVEPRKDEDLILIALNKPVGIVSTTERGTKNNIISYLKHPQRIFPIGRLDKDSQGLIFLTSDGDLVNKILRAGNQHEKEYLVTVNRPVTDHFVKRMREGVPILGTKTKKCVVEKVSEYTFKIILIQGLNRQIRRMCDYFKYEVIKLERIRIMHITIDGLHEGDWRSFTKEETAELMKMIKKSKSTSSKQSKGKKSESQKEIKSKIDKPGSQNRDSRSGARIGKSKFPKTNSRRNRGRKSSR